MRQETHIYTHTLSLSQTLLREYSHKHRGGKEVRVSPLLIMTTHGCVSGLLTVTLSESVGTWRSTTDGKQKTFNAVLSFFCHLNKQ